MRITKARVSYSVRTFKQKFLDRYKLTNIDNDTDPVVMFGMYKPEDFEFYRKHKGKVIALWCGSDGMKITSERVNIIKSRKATHVVSSKFTADDLTRWGIPYKVVPFTPALPDLKVKPRGDHIYHYGTRGDFYKLSWVPKIEKYTKLKVIKAGHDTYTRKELIKVYENCFIGLRLTDHDGLPTTVVELGLMGRRCIHNGNTPHSLPYTNMFDVCDHILEEYRNRKDCNKKISTDWHNYINISDEWLHI